MNLNQIKDFINYYLRSQTKYDVHSPAIADLLTQLFVDIEPTLAAKITHYKNHLYKINESIPLFDLGAGSTLLSGKSGIQSIRSILNSAVSGERKLKFLHNISRWYAPEQILELGTSLGFSSVSLNAAHPLSMITIEGNPALARIAEQTFNHFDCKNIQQRVGNFDVVLPEILNSSIRPQLIFIDGNHRKEPTLTYHELLKKHLLPAKFMVIYDDIYWSAGMKSAWETIKADPEVNCSIDLFHLGIAIYDPSFRQKQHFTLIDQRFKPWRMGFFKSK